MRSPSARRQARACLRSSKPLFKRFRLQGRAANHLQALIFDSWFDPYRGVVVLARVIQGVLKKGQKIRLMWNGHSFEVETSECSRPSR